MKKVDITVVTEPTYVQYDCPHCGVGVQLDYDDFNNLMAEEYWGDWKNEVIECDACGGQFQIGEVECD